MTGLMAAMGGTAALAAASRALFGIDKDEDRDIRLFLPYWSENSQLVYLPAPDVVGRRQYVDLSYTDPYEYLKKPFIAFMRGENLGDALFDAAKEAFEPFLGEEILIRAIREARSNRDMNGRPIYNTEAHPHEAMTDIVWHIGKALEPGTLTSMRRVIKGLDGHVELYGKTYDPAVEAAAVFTGHRVVELDVPQAYRFKARDWQKRMGNSRRIVTTAAIQAGPVEEADLARAYRQSEDGRRSAFADMVAVTVAAQRLGVQRTQIKKILESLGISEQDRRDIINGNYRPYKPSDQFLESMIKSSKAQDPTRAQVARTTFKERKSIIKRLANEERQRNSQRLLREKDDNRSID